jgi:hypothetical protein
VPTVSTFYGIMIQLFWKDHAPPHFHALYAEHEAVIALKDFEILRGSLPTRALVLVREWAREHSGELMEDWLLCQQNQTPQKIPPLE